MIAWYIEYEYWVAAVQLILAMLGMGAGLKIADFQKVAMQPKAATLGLMMQLVVVPLIALGFIVLTNLPPGMVIGIAIVSSIPGGTVSNIFTFMARGNVPLSISITALTSVACLVTTPMISGKNGRGFLCSASNNPSAANCFLRASNSAIKAPSPAGSRVSGEQCFRG